MPRKHLLPRHLGPVRSSVIFLAIGFGVVAGADRFLSDADRVSQTHA